MKLLLNAEALRPPITGIGNYTYHLLEQYIALGLYEQIDCFTGTDWVSGDTALSVSALSRGSTPSVPTTQQRSIQQIRELIGMIPGSKFAYDRMMDNRFKRFAAAQKHALYHETNYILKPHTGPCVTTVHDLSHVRFPQYHPEHVVKRLDSLLPESLARADIVITVSDLIRDEVIMHYGLSPEKVRTVYEGVEPAYSPRKPHETNPVLAEHGLEHGRYVLMVATLEPRKGIDTLLDAWDCLPLSLRQACPLVLVGSSGWGNDALRERLRGFYAQGTVKHLGYVPAQLLPTLYSGASVFCYPSVYEGFGLPVLDAMSSGVPVICRAGTSMAEFAKGACVLCDTGEFQELAEQLKALMEDPGQREIWGRKGLEQSRQYTWERCARETHALYRELL